METEEEKHELDPNFTPSQLTGSQPFNQSEFNDLKNVKNPLFVNKDRTILLPLRIKLDIMKQFVKILHKDGDVLLICQKITRTLYLTENK